jgi:hypothetical protein
MSCGGVSAGVEWEVEGVGMGVAHTAKGVRGWRGLRWRGLLRAEGAEAEEAFVAGEVDLDCDRRAVVGEGHRKIRRVLQLEADHGCFLN